MNQTASYPDSCYACRQAGDHVESTHPILSLSDPCQALVAEGGEGGKAAAQTGSEQEARLIAP